MLYVGSLEAYDILYRRGAYSVLESANSCVTCAHTEVSLFWEAWFRLEE